MRPGPGGVARPRLGPKCGQKVPLPKIMRPMEMDNGQPAPGILDFDADTSCTPPRFKARARQHRPRSPRHTQRRSASESDAWTATGFMLGVSRAGRRTVGSKESREIGGRSVYKTASFPQRITSDLRRIFVFFGSFCSPPFWFWHVFGKIREL